MKRHLTLFSTASRYELVVHASNQFAMLLVAAFVPTWSAVAHLVIPSTPVHFRLRGTGRILTPAGNQLTQVTSAINAVTLITGFMMFAATFASGRFDRRLALAGYPRTHLVLAKTAALAVASVAIAAYATAIACLSWTPRQPLLLATALFCASMTYGALGVVFGALLRREVEGMFALVMTSVLDTALQNPIVSSGANSWAIAFLPTYGSVQAATAAGFTGTPLRSCLAIQLTWLAGAAFLGLLAFHRRTRNALSGTPRAAALIGSPNGAGQAHRAEEDANCAPTALDTQ
ncbi:ABC transporter permease [Streptomyces triculaminicus]|uniref:ABC transporter permease n=1 Tax=Streptomyces triculaminicus TaxID=2816232 RepID=UPI0037CD3367